jgi:SpoVK/Ycf46/Vps4 family AAA+-type ATPase
MSATTSGEQQRIVILGATNRIQDIDEAILRRMPKKFPVSLPTSYQRRRILRLILRDTKIDESDFDEDLLVRVMAGMSGSDIKEACRDAAMVPVREFIKEKREMGQLGTSISHQDIRGVRTADFFGRKGGDQTIETNLQRQKREKSRNILTVTEASSNDEIEDYEGRDSMD